MSAKKFKFVSPGVFLSEIDQSQLPKTPGGIGPAIIGRTRRGPALKPVKVSSFQEFVEIFGEPVPGNEGDDPWRDGNGLLAPAYAPYAAQAYLKADINSPVTVVRLLGVAGDDSDGTDSATPGWDVDSAHGIFLFAGTSELSGPQEGNLAAVIYGVSRTATDSFATIGLEHTHADINLQYLYDNNHSAQRGGVAYDGSRLVPFSNDKLTLVITRGDGTSIKKPISFRPGSSDYIRNVLNTNPVATNSEIATAPSGTMANVFWLGESFEEEYERMYTSGSGVVHAAVIQLDDKMTDFKSANHEAAAAQSGWVVPQHNGDKTSFDTASLEKMFRFAAIQEGEQGMDLHIRIENVKIADEGSPSPYGKFDVVVVQKRGIKLHVVDSYENLNLNPNSDNFIARRIGDQYFEWDTAQKRNRLYGDHPNQSSYIRVEMGTYFSETGKVSSNPKHVPFGYLGPIVPISLACTAGNGSLAAKTSSFGSDSSGGATVGWVTGSLTNHSASAFKLNWAEVPHVVTASQGLDLVANYTFGHSPFHKKRGSKAESLTEVNLGVKDHLRRYSTFGHLTDQLDGVADNSTTKHSYIFTFDEVVVTGSAALSNDLSSYSPTIVSFEPGSHYGNNVATATLTVVDGNDNTNGQFTEKETITIVSTDGTSKVYVLVDGSETGAVATGTVLAEDSDTGAGTAGAALVGGIAVQSNLNTHNQATVLNEIRAAILHANGHNGKITCSDALVAADGNQTITLTQEKGGFAGNTAINTSISQITATAFTGGTSRAYTANYSASSLMSLVNTFAMPLHGGFDGVDITEADPFNMSARAVGPDTTTRNSYANASIDRAIELIKDPEMLEMNLAVMPGITNTTLTTKLVQTCEARADALAIIDLPDVYIPPSEAKCTSFKDRVDNTNPEKSAKALIKRQLNSSYGAAYYPWVKVRDTINGRDQWVPPSVVALGVMGYTEQRDEVWFAPAGFNRGGLNEGNAGIPVLQVSEQLLSSQRDKLYEANINPIASFVSEGLVVFGQKTLQMTPSALDRINVRRLLIFVKKEVSRIANGLLFDQNVPATWNRFTGQVVPFLESVKTRLGLTDFKVVLDKTTTTPDLVDRNIMYAKIFLKPARAIEFIAVDFVITRSGASFDD